MLAVKRKAFAEAELAKKEVDAFFRTTYIKHSAKHDALLFFLNARTANDTFLAWVHEAFDTEDLLLVFLVEGEFGNPIREVYGSRDNPFNF
jgi:hypothetical protein